MGRSLSPTNTQSSDSIWEQLPTVKTESRKQHPPATDPVSSSTQTYPQIRNPEDIPLREQNKLWDMMAGKFKRKLFISQGFATSDLT